MLLSINEAMIMSVTDIQGILIMSGIVLAIASTIPMSVMFVKLLNLK